MARHSLGRRRAVQVAAQHRHAAHHRVHVGVLEARDQQAAGQVDDLGAGPASSAQLVVGTDGDDPAGP